MESVDPNRESVSGTDAPSPPASGDHSGGRTQHRRSVSAEEGNNRQADRGSNSEADGNNDRQADTVVVEVDGELRAGHRHVWRPEKGTLAVVRGETTGRLRHLDQRGRLTLTFGDVGLTPDDRYTLTVDRETHRVTRWHFELEGGREGTFRRTDYRQFGPLASSTRRVSTGGESKVVIRFENVDVSRGDAGSREATE